MTATGEPGFVDKSIVTTSNACSETTLGIIIYTDGGCRPNPGYGGWGMHGYLYSFEAPKKSAGNSDYILTGQGYVAKSNSGLKMGPTAAEERRAYDRSVEVTPIHYVDGYGSFIEPISNNVAELCATINGLKYAANYSINDVQVYTDSEYVRKGLEGWVEGWARNNWLKADMTPPANVVYWKQLVEAKEELVRRGVTVKINWVRAHTDKNKDHPDILGNILADRLATTGVMASRSLKATTVINTTTAEGYWKYDVNRHPMINNRRMYFNTMKEYIRPGEYYLGDHGKDDDLLGKRISDGAYSVVILDQPEPVLEMLRQYHAEMARGADTIIMARLDHMYRSDTHQQLSKYGELATERMDQSRLDLVCLDREPLTRELRPAKLAMRAVEVISELAEKLDMFLRRNPEIIITDITPILYETSVKMVKKEPLRSVKLKAEYNVGYAALKDILANYLSPSGEIKSAPITLTLGIDLLDRNALKRLEDFNPQVSLISWLEAPNVFRYATVIEAGKDKGIWAGAYSNLRIVTEP